MTETETRSTESLIERLRELRDGLSALLSRTERNDAYHLFVVPDAGEPRLETFQTLPDLVARLRSLRATADALVCPFLGEPLAITGHSHCLVTGDEVYPLTTDTAADQPRPWAAFNDAPEDIPASAEPVSRATLDVEALAGDDADEALGG